MDVTFRTDFFNLDRKDFIQKYTNILPHPIKYETPYLEVAGETRYTVAPDFYVCVPRKYGYANSNLGEKKHCVARWKDGERRHSKIYLAGLVFRTVYVNELTFEQLLWLLVREVYYYYDNSDDKFTDEKMMITAYKVWYATIDLGKLKKTKYNRHRMNKAYCQRMGLTPQALSNYIRGEETDKRIAELYDFGLTDEENIKVFHEYGLKISIRTLKRWRKKNGIVRK